MAEKIYQYTQASFPNNKVSPTQLKQEILSDPGILTALERIDVVGGSSNEGVVEGTYTCDIVFKAEPTQAEKTVLDGGASQTEEISPLAGSILANHNNAEKPNKVAKLNKDNVTLTQLQPQNEGMEMCDRDFKVTTCRMSQASAVEDLKINPTTLKEEAWAGPELSLVNVYKDNAGSMEACSDQADADLNGILSVWDYKAYDQADGTTEIEFNLLEGGLVQDPGIPTGERFDHRAYVMVAPDLGQANFVRTFDGYVSGRPSSGDLSTDSPSAKLLDPALAPGANVIRIFIYHPQGQSNSHILWLKTYRPSGSF